MASRRDGHCPGTAFPAILPIMIRPAEDADIPALVRIENRSFRTDRLSPRSFRYMIARANGATLVDVDRKGTLRGYALVLFSRGTPLARLYSIAVDPAHRRHGTGRALLDAVERAARQHHAAYIRLEVRADDTRTQSLYYRSGYRRFGFHASYYADRGEALRMQKAIAPGPAPTATPIPYWPQSLDFTCGPAALMMAMRALDGKAEMTVGEELRLWRESTTVFMTSGLGGCSAYGLALAALKRGFEVELYVTDRGVPFEDSVRNAKKKEVIRLVHRDFLGQIRAAGVPVHRRALPVAALRETFDAGAIPVVLISAYPLTGEKQPHWVVVTGFDDAYVYLHDPYVDGVHARTATDRMHLPVPLKSFDRMARYGQSHQRAALILRRNGRAKPAGTI
jgi:ribosomal protein S18 acetylase RimI-like enzyme/predicted double-glycine peptidase